MIARVWRARATTAGADRYRAHFEAVVGPELLGLPGFHGAELRQRQDGSEIEIVVETRWQSMEAIRSFTGDDLGRAVVEPEARAVLLSFDARVAHYTVVADLRPS